MRIGITDCGKFENYRRWIESVPGAEVVKLSPQIQNAGEVENCDGLVLSGGEDLQPALYGKPEYAAEFHLQDIIPERDEFEYQVVENGLSRKKPILGICRGLQLVNVYLGGSLVPDIPRLFHSNAHGKVAGADQIHPIELEAGSLLYRIAGLEAGLVNSAHHQSADRPAAELKITSYSEPSIVESMEWKSPENKSWLLLVQWHPERMSDPGSPFSASLRAAFLEACRTIPHESV